MKIIKILVENIKEEMHDAEKYAKLAMEHKGENNDLCDMFNTLSKQEVGHANLLHAQAEKLIREYQAQNGAPPVAMQAVYDWEHEKMIDNMAKIKALQEMASGK